MCLATVYNTSKEPDSILLQYVSYLEVDGKQITLTDVMGETRTVTGTIKSVDLAGSTVVINCEE
jgi:predicted RNA-binding protein